MVIKKLDDNHDRNDRNGLVSGSAEFDNEKTANYS
jgi:hypothetical protein